MNKVLAIILMTCLATGVAQAGVLGLRGGLTVDPDQVHLGAHLDMGRVMPPLRLVPNLEFGFGSDVTVVAFNGDLLFDVPASQFYVGGELGVIMTSWDAPPGVDDTDSDLGMSAVGGFTNRLRNGQELLFELKLGLIDAPDLKLTAGLTLF